MTYLKDFRERIQNNDYPGFLKIWEEYCFGDQPDGEEIIAILESVKASELAKPFGAHVERIIPLWRELKDPQLSDLCLMLIFDLQTSHSETLAELALSHLKTRYANDPLLLEHLRMVGLRNREKFQSAIRNFSLLVHLQKGNFVFHTAGWGTGEIIDVSPVREEVSLECEYVTGTQHLSFEKAFRTLQPIPKDHFYARRFGDPDALEQEARQDPSTMIRMLLKDLGPRTATEIKDELYDLVIPAADWNRWWQTARTKIKKDTKIESPKDAKQPFQLREKELPHEVAFHKLLENQPEIMASITMIYAFLRDFPETLKNSQFKAALEARIQQFLTRTHLPIHQQLSLLFLLEDLGNPTAVAAIVASVQQCDQMAAEIAQMQVIPFQKRALQHFKKEKTNWIDGFLDLLFTVEQNLVRDFLLMELDQPATRAQLTQKLGSLTLHPLIHPEIFFWYFQKLTSSRTAIPFADPEGKKRFFEALLIILDGLEKRPQYRDLSKKIVQLLEHDRYKLIRDIFQTTTLPEVKEYLLLATKCGILTDHDIKIFHSLAEVIHPSLARPRKLKESQEAEEPELWTTLEGYQKVQQRIQDIATVETVLNAREIEAARALGDLRENAEFKAALERRDRLQAELKLLSDQMQRARVLTAVDVSTDAVGVGSVVYCRDHAGEESRFVLLGPWDADPEKRILSSQSKFAQSMKGHRRGEKFSFQGEEFEITEIDSFFNIVI